MEALVPEETRIEPPVCVLLSPAVIDKEPPILFSVSPTDICTSPPIPRLELVVNSILPDICPALELVPVFN